MFSKVVEYPENEGYVPGLAEKSVHVFSDASFGTEFKSFKSITGIVVYLYGTPIAWKSKVQSVFTSCTTQSEWVALSDAIEFSNTIGGLHKFLIGQEEVGVEKIDDGPLHCDNRAAVLNARKGRADIKEMSCIKKCRA